MMKCWLSVSVIRFLALILELPAVEWNECQCWLWCIRYLISSLPAYVCIICHCQKRSGPLSHCCSFSYWDLAAADKTLESDVTRARHVARSVRLSTRHLLYTQIAVIMFMYNTFTTIQYDFLQTFKLCLYCRKHDRDEVDTDQQWFEKRHYPPSRNHDALIPQDPVHTWDYRPAIDRR